MMVQTEMRFVRLLEDIDNAQEELFDLGGEENSISDDCWDDESCYDADGKLTEEADIRLEEIDVEAGLLEITLTKIQEEMGLNESQFDCMRDSAIVNRWELYANFMGAEIVSLVDIANGKA